MSSISEKQREKQREWYRRYFERNKEVIKERQRLYRIANRERINALNLQKYHANMANGIKRIEPRNLCPLCSIELTRKNIRSHLIRRHKKSEDEANMLYCSLSTAQSIPQSVPQTIPQTIHET